MPAAVVVMTKVPRPGGVKTRLCPPLSPGEAAELSACFILDTLRKVAASSAGLVIAFDPPDGRPELEPHAPSGARWVVQCGEDLGQRQEHALARAAQEFSPLLIVGTDSPTLPAAHLAEAFTRLNEAADVVLGPTLDGGYCLLGVRRPLPGLLAGVTWSTGAVCAQVQENARRSGLRVATLPTWYDVDTPEDLRRLSRDCDTSREARSSAPFTCRWLRDHADRPWLRPSGPADTACRETGD